MHHPVGWFEIYVQDMPRAKAFYETVLGRTLSRLELPGDDSGMEMWSFGMGEGASDAPGATGALVRMPGVPSGGNSTLVYFVSEDCAVEASRAQAAGGRVERPKMSIGPYGHIALLVDTEGNLFGVHSMA